VLDWRPDIWKNLLYPVQCTHNIHQSCSLIRKFPQKLPLVPTAIFSMKLRHTSCRLHQRTKWNENCHGATIQAYIQWWCAVIHIDTRTSTPTRPICSRRPGNAWHCACTYVHALGHGRTIGESDGGVDSHCVNSIHLFGLTF
jgi:hypothetical protein